MFLFITIFPLRQTNQRNTYQHVDVATCKKTLTFDQNLVKLDQIQVLTLIGFAEAYRFIGIFDTPSFTYYDRACSDNYLKLGSNCFSIDSRDKMLSCIFDQSIQYSSVPKIICSSRTRLDSKSMQQRQRNPTASQSQIQAVMFGPFKLIQDIFKQAINKIRKFPWRFIK